jgi:hypothetical protein
LKRGRRCFSGGVEVGELDAEYAAERAEGLLQVGDGGEQGRELRVGQTIPQLVGKALRLGQEADQPAEACGKAGRRSVARTIEGLG